MEVLNLPLQSGEHVCDAKDDRREIWRGGRVCDGQMWSKHQRRRANTAKSNKQGTANTLTVTSSLIAAHVAPSTPRSVHCDRHEVWFGSKWVSCCHNGPIWPKKRARTPGLCCSTKRREIRPHSIIKRFALPVQHSLGGRCFRAIAASSLHQACKEGCEGVILRFTI